MKVLVGGDLCPRFRTKDVIENNSYEEHLKDVTRIVREADYAIVNLECPIVKGFGTPIIKQGPNLKCSPKVLDAISFMGFHCVTLANNHFYDQGEIGVKDTLDLLSERGVDFVGGGRNLIEAQKVLYKTIGGSILAIVNCCEHEFSIATDLTGGSNPLNPVKQFASIREARCSADYVLVIVHGGHEHYQLPSPRMVETYRFFIDAGADVVINHHQHCYSGYELYHEKPIFYGIGNLYFDTEPIKINQPWNYGYLVMLNFNEGKISFEIHPYEQCGNDPVVSMLRKDSFRDNLMVLNSTIRDHDRLMAETINYYTKAMREVEFFIDPYQNRVIRGLSRRGLFPTLIKRKWLLKIQDYLMCESHRDKVEYYLKHK